MLRSAPPAARLNSSPAPDPQHGSGRLARGGSCPAAGRGGVSVCVEGRRGCRCLCTPRAPAGGGAGSGRSGAVAALSGGRRAFRPSGPSGPGDLWLLLGFGSSPRGQSGRAGRRGRASLSRSPRTPRRAAALCARAREGGGHTAGLPVGAWRARGPTTALERLSSGKNEPALGPFPHRGMSGSPSPVGTRGSCDPRNNRRPLGLSSPLGGCRALAKPVPVTSQAWGRLTGGGETPLSRY